MWCLASRRSIRGRTPPQPYAKFHRFADLWRREGRKTDSIDKQNIFASINSYPAATVTSSAPFLASYHRCEAPRLDSQSHPWLNSLRLLIFGLKLQMKTVSLLMKRARNKVKAFSYFSVQTKARSVKVNPPRESKKHWAYWIASKSKSHPNELWSHQSINYHMLQIDHLMKRLRLPLH